MKYIKKLNIDFDNWDNLKNDNKNIKLFINNPLKYALYLNKEQYYNIFLPYIKENNIKLYWNKSKKLNKKNFNDFIVLYIFFNKLSYSNLDYFNKYQNKRKLLKII
jgi:hypothetical protein